MGQERDGGEGVANVSTFPNHSIRGGVKLQRHSVKLLTGEGEGECVRPHLSHI